MRNFEGCAFQKMATTKLIRQYDLELLTINIPVPFHL